MSLSTTGLRALRAVRSNLNTALLRSNKPIPSSPASLTSRLANSSCYPRPPAKSQKAYAFLPPLRSQPSHFLSRLSRETRTKQQNFHHRQNHHGPMKKDSLRERIKARIDWFLWTRVQFPVTQTHYYMMYSIPFLVLLNVFLDKIIAKQREEKEMQRWEEWFEREMRRRSKRDDISGPKVHEETKSGPI